MANTDPSLVNRLFARHAAGLPFPPISGGDGTTDTKTETKVEPPAAPDLGKLIDAAVAKHGDQTSALKAFAADLYAARDDLKAVRAKLPADGSIVLTGDNAKDWGAYQGLGKPSELRKTVDEHKTLSATTAAYERAEVLRGVAEKASTPTSKVSYPVLARLAGPHLTFEPRMVKGKDGKEVEVMHVLDPTGVAADAKPVAVPFDEYAAKNWAEFLPALKPGETAKEKLKPLSTPSRLDITHRELPAPEPEGQTIVTRLRALGAGSF